MIRENALQAEGTNVPADDLVTQGPRDRVRDILAALRFRGIRLWSDNGILHYEGPKGALSQADKEKLRRHSAGIVAVLDKAMAAQTTDIPVDQYRGVTRAPLSFSQLAHWNLYALSTRASVCLVSSAIEIRGKLRIDALRKGIEEIVRRHDALRTRIVIREGVPIQEVQNSLAYDLKIDDLTAFRIGLRSMEAANHLEKYLREPTNVCADPLFRTSLVKFGDEEQVLVLSMEHIIADGLSIGVVVQELFAAYDWVLKGRSCDLPEVLVQFPQYAAWQRSSHEAWVAKHGAYWEKHLKGCARLRFPYANDSMTTSSFDWGLLPVRVGWELKAKLLDWCRTRRTTLVLAVFTAYVGLVFRWCKAEDAVFLYQADGRLSPEVRRAVGYFSFPLYLRLTVSENDTFGDLLRHITEEYCKASYHADFSYFESEIPRAAFTRNTCFNWLPQHSVVGVPDLEESPDSISCAQVPFGRTVIRNFYKDTEPMMGLRDEGDEIDGQLQFSVNRFDAEKMQEFVDNFIRFLRALVSEPNQPLSQIALL